jgi:hypothetical protein
VLFVVNVMVVFFVGPRKYRCTLKTWYGCPCARRRLEGDR